MVLPMWLGALGAAGGGFMQALQKRKDDQQRQQMIQALLGRRAQQNPGGFGATPSSYGPQNWGAQNQVQSGVVHDQWGNPIGPVGASAGGGGSPAAPPPVAQAADPSQGAAAIPPMPTNTYPPMATAQPVSFMGGPSQATPPPGTGGYQAPQSSMDDAIMQALFAPQGA